MKIVQIGFNKCGTTSIDIFLRKCGYSTVHWDHGCLAQTIRKNIKDNLPPLSGYETYQCFSDMEYVTNNDFLYAFMDFYKEIDQHYDDVFFILNVRPINNWIQSRIKHNNGSYLSRFISIKNSNQDEVISYWKSLWENHINDVEDYFKDKNNCLVFDIEKDTGDKLCEFLQLDAKFSSHYGHYHKT